MSRHTQFNGVKSARPNPILLAAEKKYAAIYARQAALDKLEYAGKIDTAMQMCCDAAMIAWDEGKDAEDALTFYNTYRNTVNEISRLLAADGKDDKDLWYSTQKIDDRLHAILGDDLFSPWDARYKVAAGDPVPCKWISAEDMSPAYGESILVCYANNGKLNVAATESEVSTPHTAGLKPTYHGCEVLYWMPLPKPPREAKA